MFRNLKTKKAPCRYRINKPEKVPGLTNKNLWDVPRPEYLAYGYPDMVLSIIEVRGIISYEGIKKILNENGIPTDLAYIIIAVNDLISQNKIRKVSPYTYTLQIPE